MKGFVISAILLALVLGPSTAVLADDEFSVTARITQLNVIEGFDVLRMSLSRGTGANPAGCDSDLKVDIELNLPSRTDEEQQLMLNSVYLAFMTSRTVQFLITDSICSSVSVLDSRSFPTAVGVTVSN